MSLTKDKLLPTEKKKKKKGRGRGIHEEDKLLLLPILSIYLYKKPFLQTYL